MGDRSKHGFSSILSFFFFRTEMVRKIEGQHQLVRLTTSNSSLLPFFFLNPHPAYLIFPPSSCSKRRSESSGTSLDPGSQQLTMVSPIRPVLSPHALVRAHLLPPSLPPRHLSFVGRLSFLSEGNMLFRIQLQVNPPRFSLSSKLRGSQY